MPFVFIGDEAFKLSEHLMKPYARRSLDDIKRIYNYRLSFGRQMVECTCQAQIRGQGGIMIAAPLVGGDSATTEQIQSESKVPRTEKVCASKRRRCSGHVFAFAHLPN
jgi:hypothetical protein